MHTLSYKKDKKVLTFEADGQTYTLGSKLFPFSKKKNIGFWHINNTEEPKRNERLMQFLDAVQDPPFVTGKCYRNAEAVRVVGERLKLNIKFYSGWLFDFSTSPLPVHHSWNVLDNRILIDTSMTKTLFRINDFMLKWSDENKEVSKDEWRKKYVEVTEAELKKQLPISQEMVYGKVPKSLVYVGTEDTYSNAQTTIFTLLDEVKNHPSYPHSRNDMGESPTQIMLKEKGLFK